MNSAQAWEAGGFFNWLRKDKEGQTMITSPDYLGVDVGEPEWYYDYKDIPEEYQKYLFLSNTTGELEDCKLKGVVVENGNAMKKISESWIVAGNKKVNVGVYVYEDKVLMLRDKYDQYIYQYSYNVNNCAHDVFEKEGDSEEKEYSIFFYDNNKRYFVAGQLEVEMMRELAIAYMNFVIK